MNDSLTLTSNSIH